MRVCSFPSSARENRRNGPQAPMAERQLRSRLQRGKRRVRTTAIVAIAIVQRIEISAQRGRLWHICRKCCFAGGSRASAAHAAIVDRARPLSGLAGWVAPQSAGESECAFRAAAVLIDHLPQRTAVGDESLLTATNAAASDGGDDELAAIHRGRGRFKTVYESWR
jgi:hypothetical protein